MSSKRNRYLGVQPFKTSDRHLFYGRDDDIKYLHDMLMLEKLVVLFGKSGYGKSSLISAGLIPRLYDEKQKVSFQYKPIEIRFGNYIKNQSLSLIETVKRAIDQVPVSKEATFLKQETQFESIWVQLKRREATFNNRFVLIFDQFEEFFSYPLDQQYEFRKQLAETLYRTIPADLLDIFEDLSDEQRKLISDSLDVKVLLSIRSDRMSKLDSMKDMLPAILNKRYELKPLSREQARQAIVKPALKGFDKEESWKKEFVTQPFEYFPKALDKILGELSSDLNGGIEAFQLQIVCAEIERAVQHDKIPDRDGNGLPDIDLPDLPDFRNLYETYYQGRLDEIPEDKRLAAQLVLEDGLLAADQATGEASRMSVDGRALIKQFSATGLTDDLLGRLERTYLIRKEANNFRGFNYEISHDTLVGPMQKAKAERVAAKEKAEAERVAAEEKAAAAKRIKRLVGIVVVAVALMVGAGALTVWALALKRMAQDAETEALNAKKTIEMEKDRALEQEEIAKKATSIAENALDSVQFLADQLKLVVGEKELAEVERKQQKKLAEDRKKQAELNDQQLQRAEIENEISQLESKILLTQDTLRLGRQRLNATRTSLQNFKEANLEDWNDQAKAFVQDEKQGFLERIRNDSSQLVLLERKIERFESQINEKQNLLNSSSQ